MKTTAEIIQLLKAFKKRSASKYGIRTLGIFGSYARSQQDEQSDLDVFVVLNEPDFFTLEKIKEELELLVQLPMDIVHYRESLRQSLKESIQRDAIYL
jgi:predicted nucleotidyltransferase